jgi:hypothetical protein
LIKLSFGFLVLEELLTTTTNQKKILTVMAYNSTNIIKPKESFNSDGQQFHQDQQNKRKFIKQRWSTIPPISTNFVDIGGIVDHHCLNFLLVC